MRANVSGFEGTPAVRKFRGGQSNPTFLVEAERRAFVLRRKPVGSLVTGAHAIDREYRVIQALHKVGFPVPRTHGICEDASIAGASFYLMDRVEGRIFWETSLPMVAPGSRRQYFAAMNRTIADLHNVRFDDIGLGDFGPGQGYVGRQVRRWSEAYEATKTMCGAVPDIAQVADWLKANLPNDEEIALIHGDFRCDNMIFHPTGPTIAAVLDWELSTIGNPLADFAHHAMIYRMPPDYLTGLYGLDLAKFGLPSEDEYLSQYCANARRSDLPHYDFYVVFAIYRLASILYGIRLRTAQRTASSITADRVSRLIEPLARLAREQANAINTNGATR